MTELERRALLGDPEAQRECTEKGIALPCSRCGRQGATVKYSIGYYWYQCPYCHSSNGPLSNPKLALAVWNTLQAPPIGRCDDCNHRYENENNEYECEIHNMCPDDNFYCKDFEPKEREKND